MTCAEFERLTRGNFFASTRAEKAAAVKHANGCDACYGELWARAEASRARLQEAERPAMDRKAMNLALQAYLDLQQDPEARP